MRQEQMRSRTCQYFTTHDESHETKSRRQSCRSTATRCSGKCGTPYQVRPECPLLTGRSFSSRRLVQRLQPKRALAAAVLAYSAWNGYALLVQVCSHARFPGRFQDPCIFFEPSLLASCIRGSPLSWQQGAGRPCPEAGDALRPPSPDTCLTVSLSHSCLRSATGRGCSTRSRAPSPSRSSGVNFGTSGSVSRM